MRLAPILLLLVALGALAQPSNPRPGGGGAATNAVSTLKTNGTTVVSGATSLDFTNSSTVTWTVNGAGVVQATAIGGSGISSATATNVARSVAGGFYDIVEGDSMSDTNTAPPGGSPWKWPALITTNISYTNYVVVNNSYAAGGKTIAQAITNALNYRSLYTNLLSERVGFKIFLGYNTLKTSLTTAKQEITNLIYIIRTNYPFSPISVATIPYTNANTEVGAANFIAFNEYLRTNATRYNPLVGGYALVDLATNSNILIDSDTIHPTEASQPYIRDMFVQGSPINVPIFSRGDTATGRTAVDILGNPLGSTSQTGSVSNAVTYNYVTNATPTLAATNYANVTINGTNYFIPIYLAVQKVAGTNGVVAWWRFDEQTGYDSIGENTLTLSGVTFSDGVSPASVYAAYFDGSTQYGYAAYTAELQPTNITVACWLYPATGDTLTSFPLSVPANSVGNASPYNSYCFLVLGNPGDVDVYWQCAITNGTPTAYNQKAAALPRYEWVHCVGTFDGQAMKFYTNGVLAASNSHPGKLYYGAQNQLTLGRLGMGSSQNVYYYSDAIDEIKIATNAWTLSDIQGLYNAEKP